MKKTLTLTVVTIATAIALAGCSSGTGGGSMPGMNHESTPAQSSAPAAASAGDHNAADTAFAQMMIPHHAQAVQMSDAVLAKKDLPAQVTALAGRITAAQGPEIEKMRGWLKNWSEPAAMSGDHTMNGMMGEEDMKILAASQGLEAAKLFLTQMIAHHQGAVIMAQKESTGGKNAAALALSKEIVTAQEAEIKEMKELLGKL